MGNVLADSVPEKYLDLISIYYASKNNNQVSVRETNTGTYKSNKKLKGFAGWLVVYIVVLSCSIVFSIIESATNTISTQECNVLNSQYNGACTALQPLFNFETFSVAILIIFDITVLFMVLLRKKIATTLVIIAAIATISWNTIDMIMVSQAFSSHDFPSSVTSEIMGESILLIIGNAIFCGVFIPYFLKSERVKLTLVEKIIL
jgi:hypothetical protein